MRTCYGRRHSPDILKPHHPRALGRGRHGENKQPAEQGDPSGGPSHLPRPGTGSLVSPTRHRVPADRASPPMLVPLPALAVLPVGPLLGMPL